MSTKNTVPSSLRYLSANATLSNICVTVFTESDSHQHLTEQKSIPSNSSPIGHYPQSEKVKQDMKENKETPVQPKATQKDKNDNAKRPTTPLTKTPISKLSIVAIGLTLCLGGFTYFHGHQQAITQKATIEQLQSEINTLKDTLQQTITDDIKVHVAQAVDTQNKQLNSLQQQVSSQLTNQAKAQEQFINKVDDSIKVSEQNIVNFNERLSAMSTTDNNIWLISQANYLVNLAGRKIWNDQDYTTARLLLKNADTSLAQANDPSLLPARHAINKDISALAAISFTDFDGIIMTLMNLVDSVTELPLVDHYKEIDLALIEHDDSITEHPTEGDDNNLVTDSAKSSQPVDTQAPSSSISDWYENLTKSSASFFAKFIQVEKYDSFGECIANAGQDAALLEKCQAHTAVIMPEQALYLRENIKLRLLIAAQAVPRHQELIYQRALNDVSVWANAYFDSHASSVKAFLDELNNLQQQSISNQNVPQQLSSRDELDKLMQTRVRAMLAN
ncbi:uroporphyrinogen-III C-methyltransferase [Orbus sasakiae]|uniref:Uroporphyrinogen-III C-methyltransferase n=1 Tax=Orbus sasakiae TaxID=1078475 RepID=A0ABP9N3Q2_9GAMM